MGNALGIVSGLILGQSAVGADIVSPLLLIVVAASGLGGFCIPNYALSVGMKIIQLLFLTAGALGGLYLMALLGLALLCAACAIRALPGVGDYTAGAIASICFGLPEPAVDGNVLRVLSRVTDDAAPVTDAAVKREYAARLREIYPAGRCGDFTQSLMELGATVCGPNSQPQCALCPLASLCLARANGTALLRPVKAPKKEKRTEEKTVFILRCGTRIAVRRRPEQGLLAGLWELPNVDGKCSAQQALAQAERWGVHPRELCRSSEKTHIFTHIRWELRGFYIECAEAAPLFTWVDPARFRQDIALPTAFRIFEAFEEV